MALVKVTAETLAEPMEFEQVLLETTFGVFKEEVATRYGSPAPAFRLYFGGKYCEGGVTLASRGVVEGASIRLTANLDKEARGKKRVLVGETKRGKYATLIRQGKDTKEAVDAVARTQQEVLTGQAKAQADLTAIRAAIEPMQPMRIPGELELMEKILSNMMVSDMNSLICRWGIALPPRSNKNIKARLLAEKAPLAELQEVLRTRPLRGRASRPLGLGASDQVEFEARLAALQLAQAAGPLDAYNQDQENSLDVEAELDQEPGVEATNDAEELEARQEFQAMDEVAAAQGAAASSSRDASAPVASES